MIAEPLDLLYTQTAVIIGMVYQLLPYAVLPLYVSFASIDLDLIQAAEGLGASRVRAIASIVTPLATPGILATATIVYVISLGFYLTPVILGGATSPFTATLISQNIFDFFDLAGASVSAILLLLGALIAVTLGYLLVGRERLRRALA
jgi:ABC-type spermidine/putrescine transport system permease subunit I